MRFGWKNVTISWRCSVLGVGWLAVGILLLLGGISAVAADQVVGSTNDRVEVEYQALLALKVSPAVFGDAYFKANAQIHEKGLAFLKKFSTHPRRWDVVALMSGAVRFTREEVGADGGVQIVRDRAREQAWAEEYRRMTAELLAAPDASREARENSLRFLIRKIAIDVAEKSISNARESVAAMKVLLDDLEGLSPERVLIGEYRDYARSLEAVDPVACVEYLRELARRHTGKSSMDRTMREFAAAHLKLMEGQASPVWDQLAAIDPSIANTSNLRGKVVLIALFPVTWTQYANLLTEVHGKFREQDFEIIQITADRPAVKAMQGPGRPPEPAWRVVRDRENNLGRAVARLGLSSIPSWLIVARDGKFVTDITTRTLVTVIERELALE